MSDDLQCTKNDEDLEFQYTPSRWTERFGSREEVLEHHVRFVREESRKVRESVPWISRRYGDSERQAVDIFGTDLENGSPIVIYIHGGFWQELSREDSCYPVRPLYERGVKTAVVGYDLCPSVTLRAVVGQAVAAVEEVLHYAEENNSRYVCISGHSAGAHLAALALDAVKSTRVKGAFLASGIFDIKPIMATTNWILLGVDDNQEDISGLSPICKNFTGINAHVIITVGRKESPEFRRQSKRMCAYIQSKDIKVEYVEKELDDHFSIVESFAGPENDLLKFISSILENDPQQ